MITEHKDYALYSISRLYESRKGTFKNYVVLHRTPEEAIQLVHDVLQDSVSPCPKSLLVVQETCPFNEFDTATCTIESPDIIDFRQVNAVRGRAFEQFRYELEIFAVGNQRVALMREYENKIHEGDGLQNNWVMIGRMVWPFEKMDVIITVFSKFTSTF